MSDVVEVSYTGDILAHRRCPRAWAYHRHVGLHPYEQVQAMEGMLAHHSMEWLTGFYRKNGHHANAKELSDQLISRYGVLRSRGVRSEFVKKTVIVSRVVSILFPLATPASLPEGTFDASALLDEVVRACVEGALHTEYEIKSVQTLAPGVYPSKNKYLLRGVLDLVRQESGTFQYRRFFEISDSLECSGTLKTGSVATEVDDVEIWDYKASNPDTPYIGDYVRQLLTYAAIYQLHTGILAKRCVLAFLKRPKKGTLAEHLIAIDISQAMVDAALSWTSSQIAGIGASVLTFRANPLSIPSGDYGSGSISSELRNQCTACGQRFDCPSYKSTSPSDCDPSRIDKN
jgi:hypothetical protein